MNLNELDLNSVTPVDGYGPGFFRIAGKVCEGHQLILPGGVYNWSGYEDTEVLVASASTVDVLLVGTGASMTPLPSAFKHALTEAGVGLEPMASPTACRTYNVLLSEGRRVAAALLTVEG